MLRNEYLNQTFNFMPEIKRAYDDQVKNLKYEEYQDQIMAKKKYKTEGKMHG